MSRAAIRYAKAVLDLTSEASTSKEVYGEMKDVQKTIEGSKELQLMLKSPIVKHEDKRAVLKEIFQGNSKTILSLMDILLNNKRVNLLEGIAESYISQYNKQEGIIEALVTTAIPLEESLKQKVMAKVKELTGATNVILTKKLDPSILGGFILRVGDMQYNASIANNFDQLKKELNTSR
ncbi:MAG: ATP synthase F1 subunit delta [Flavobacteriaceae bacterium CG_4_8_14_3_um_filter_34_10]|nr:ATP synthase F1 subunit delta [Flavobacteriia bacterium]OIP51778.1 MAG: ATP synthase F1 subunit delta [Flavobacteriaceae bacterium CG2_30_34_30]PIQ18870.1 MAG: ATP synthase F1 subunit delta [Flavobacteriaceae bacterium CG18_big_fil_WC_8_21_14_2_50_34_36]PIV49982.1 MAG: ATP synthase F1 subunit delta [Flavobacteriaceae bacterium CG02_land_8_20_14_3_00_34_13]PIX08206.1 MAG: ATP synthase F1 subunit delta [Flavobacteriaceae bacterium CG_4_8_14_3_um_filter_34_10]PIZ07148.1 MAG: ATP synthase F1 su